jgi:excisionase family DNA binding protein
VSVTSTGCTQAEKKLQRITCSVAEASAISDLAESTIRRLAREGKLRSVRVLARRLIYIDSLHALLKPKEEQSAA